MVIVINLPNCVCSMILIKKVLEDFFSPIILTAYTFYLLPYKYIYIFNLFTACWRPGLLVGRS